MFEYLAEMSEFRAGLFWGFLLGVVGNILVNVASVLVTRRAAHAVAMELDGKWTAFNLLPDRQIDKEPMDGALLTVLRLEKSWWMEGSHILTVHAEDDTGRVIRHHHGYLAVDPTFTWRGIRTVRYPGTGEIIEQRIEISEDRRILWAFPADRTMGHRDHVLRRNT